MEGADNSSQKYTLKGSRGAGTKVTGKANIFAVLDRGIRRSEAKNTNKGAKVPFLEPKKVK